ncbi:MAG: amidase family protein [Parvibaculum sp.]|uniref:amidase family protein n=1 Tax=Parvibaculum sp. TaxID=2024848 RepID=UPI003C796165
MTVRLNRRTFLGTAAASAIVAGAASLRPPFAYAKENFGKLDAMAQAELVRKKEVTALELVDAAIARIEAVNPKVNAVVTEFFDKARAAAKGKLPDSPLSGVPYLIKDLDDVKGTRHTSGSRLFANMISDKTSPVPESAIKAGMVILGKTNTPEFGLLGTTESLLLGPCHNPWNLEHSSGGSSGGAAAAVASGMLPVAHASDGGGSIRIPASTCGVFGMKPSRGRMNIGLKMAADIGVENCVSRTVRDNAMVFSLSEDRSPLKPVGFISGPSKKRLKIAFNTVNYYGKEPHEDVKAAVEATAKLCAGLGHEIIEVQNPVNGEEMIDAFLTVWASGPADLLQLAKSKGLKPEDVLEPWTIGLAEFFARKPKDALQKSLAYFAEAEKKVNAFMANYDTWLTPVLQTPAPKLGDQAPTVPFDTLYKRTIEYVTYTPIHNIAGTPAMSVPLGMSKDGLPIGSQFAAAMGGEGLLYALAYELEQAQPWADKHAPTYAS